MNRLSVLFGEKILFGEKNSKEREGKGFSLSPVPRSTKRPVHRLAQKWNIKLGRCYLNKMTRIFSAVHHSLLCNLEVTRYSVHTRYIFWFPSTFSNIFCTLCCKSFFYGFVYECLFILNIVQNGYFDCNLNFYKFHKFLNSYPKEDAIFQNPRHVWFTSKNFMYCY